jgi:TolB-like protein
MNPASKLHPNQRLGSWKEIAAFFACDERTVRRWEHERALPVHRTPGAPGGKVFAFTDELTEWLAASRNSTASPIRPEAAEPGPGDATHPPTIIDSGSPVERVSAPEPPIQRTATSPRWKVVLVMAPIFALAVLTLATLYRSPGLDSIAVLPFVNAGGDTNTDFLSDGITESLIDNLAHVPELKVRSRNSVFRYKGKEVDVQKAGSDLGVSALVSGRVVPRGDTIEVSAELTDVRDNTVIWGQHYNVKSADVLSLQQQIAGDIANKLRSQLSASEKQQITRQGTENPEAYELYLRGRYAWNKRTAAELETAIFYFNQAIAKDPNYAFAYSGLADTFAVLPNYGGTPSEDFLKSSAAARRALELDPTLAHPHAVLGENEMQYDWNFTGGEAEFKKAFALDPNDATAHQWYADNLSMIGGREQEALAEITRARQLDPLSPVIRRVEGSVRVMARQFDEGIIVCKKLASEEPRFAIAHDCLAYAYWGKRMYPQVIEEWKTAARLSSNQTDIEFADALDEGFHSSGWNGALKRAVENMLAQRQNGHYVAAWKIARFYSDLGDKEQAFHWLDIAYQEHDWLLIGLKTHFPFDPIRSDPRFAELERKVGVPQ